MAHLFAALERYLPGTEMTVSVEPGKHLLAPCLALLSGTPDLPPPRTEVSVFLDRRREYSDETTVRPRGDRAIGARGC